MWNEDIFDSITWNDAIFYSIIQTEGRVLVLLVLLIIFKEG